MQMHDCHIALSSFKQRTRNPAKTNHLYDIYTMLVQRRRRCINVIQIFCVCWVDIICCHTKPKMQYMLIYCISVLQSGIGQPAYNNFIIIILLMFHYWTIMTQDQARSSKPNWSHEVSMLFILYDQVSDKKSYYKKIMVVQI